jgi:branched-chain amino acid transport system permease protein
MHFLVDLLGLGDVNIHQQIVNAMWRGSLYSLFALGYTLIFSILGILNLSHSAIFMWGAMIGMTSVCGESVFNGGSCVELHGSIWLSIPAAMIGGGIIAILVDRAAFHPLRKRNAPRLAQLISSIGASIILINLAQLQFGANPKVFPPKSLPSKPVENLPYGVIVTQLQLLVFIIALVLMVILGYIVARTTLGKQMRTVAFSDQVSGLLGINVDNVYFISFFASGALAGAGGALYALAFNASPFMGNTLALKGLTVIVLGGLGSIRGAVVGGFLVAILEVYAIAVGYSELQEMFVFTIFFLIVLIRPQGLLGHPIEDRA